VLDEAYKMVDNRQQNIDQMLKHVHVVKNRPQYVSPHLQ